MNTNIIDIAFMNNDEFIDDENILDTIENDDDIIVIKDLSIDVVLRLNALERYYNNEGENKTFEIVSTLCSMYQMSGTKVLEEYLYHICCDSNISIVLKIQAVKTLIEYEELEEGSESDDDDETKKYKKINNERVRKNNNNKKKRAYYALNSVCKLFGNSSNIIASTCIVDAICMLMPSEEFKIEASNYFNNIVCDQRIECDFRYKTILALENIGSRYIRDEIIYLFWDKEFMKEMYEYFKETISNIFPKININLDNYYSWNKFLQALSYKQLVDMYIKTFSSEPYTTFFIKKSQIAFLLNDSNLNFYKILAGQYLLQKCKLKDDEKILIQNNLLDISKDTSIDYNRRADAADVLLRLGSEEMKKIARTIIMELGFSDKYNNNIFDNQQNVHVVEVEKSVIEALEFLNTIEEYKVNNSIIDYNYVNSKIENKLEEYSKNIFLINSKTHQNDKTTYKYNDCDIDNKYKCNYCTSKKNINDDIDFCSSNCSELFERDTKIRLALNRIAIDCALYSTFNNTLSSILVKVYSYIMFQKEENIRDEMLKRLLEELTEMSGTCSSGFIARLVNVISGFSNFSIRISWEDQIIANFKGRLNSYARNITQKGDNNIFRNEKLYDLIELWMNTPKNKKILEQLKNELICNNKKSGLILIDDIITLFLQNNKEQKINQCIEDLEENVLIELTSINNSSYDYKDRLYFSFFFRTYVSIIREELYNEFNSFISDTDFDLYFRKAIMFYELGEK